MVNFAYTILYVTDLEKTMTFYEKAFGFKRKFIAPGNEYGELDTGNTTLSFAVTSLAEKNLPGGFIKSNPGGKPFAVEIAFTTNDVDKTYAKAVKAGAIEVRKAEKKPWGQIVAYVKDPEGFLIEICTPIE
jgi:uncharacterized glyoxalase superfamily protein PhnB